MVYFHTVFRLVVLWTLLLVSASYDFTQSSSEKWLRVSTGEDSIIEVNPLGLIVEPDQVIRAQFRTILTMPEMVPGKADIRYLTRLDSIQFSARLSKYKIYESSFIDDSGKVVAHDLYGDASEWKPIWGRTGAQLYGAAKQLRPFGTWKIVSYRYANGEKPSKDDPSELKELIGKYVRLEPDVIAVNNDECRSSTLEPKTITEEAFAKLTGSSLADLGFSGKKIDAIRIVCNSVNSGFPPQTFILRVTDKNALILWEGVFIELERPPNPFNP